MKDALTTPGSAKLSGALVTAGPRRVSTGAARLIVSGVGIALAAVGLASDAVRNGEGVLTATAVLPIAAAIAACLLAAGIGTAFSTAARWSALFIVAQAASLILVDAGNTLHYQHLRLPGSLGPVGTIALAILALQGVLVLTFLARRWHAVLAWVRDTLGAFRAALWLAVLVTCSATVNANVEAYAAQIVLASVLQLVAVGNLLSIGSSIPDDVSSMARRLADRLLGPPAAHGVPDHGGTDRFAWTCGAAITLVSALLSIFVYQRHPHVQDEVKYLLQAQYFAAGVLALPVPPVPKAFEMYLMEVGPLGWYSVVPPGWAAVLALGVRAGAGWLVNPLLTGVNIILGYVLLRSLYDRRTARVATLLLALSPMNVFLGMSYMAHPMTLTCALLGALGVQRARRTGSIWPTLLGGMAVGFIVIVRQLDGAIVAAALGLWCLGLGGKRVGLAPTAALAAGIVLGVLPLLGYNWIFTGRATTFPIMAYHDRLFGKNVNAYGFGPDRGMGWAMDPNPGHSVFDAVINTNLNVTSLNVELFGWGIGSLLVVAFLVIRSHLTRTDRSLLFILVATAAAYFPNYFSGGPDFGARYWFPMVVPLAALTARGLRELGARLGPNGGVRVAAVWTTLTVGSVGLFMPWRALDKYYHYLNMRPEPRAMASDPAFAGAIVLVRGVELPDYLSAAIYNPLDLHSAAPIFAHDVDPSVRRDVLRAYADRPVVIVDGPSLTNAGYRVVQRAASARELWSKEAP